MHDDHKGHATLRGHRGEKPLQSHESAGGATQPHDRQLGVTRFGNEVFDLCALLLLYHIRGECGQAVVFRVVGRGGFRACFARRHSSRC